jgi:hypothetical protein
MINLVRYDSHISLYQHKKHFLQFWISKGELAQISKGELAQVFFQQTQETWNKNFTAKVVANNYFLLAYQ